MQDPAMRDPSIARFATKLTHAQKGCLHMQKASTPEAQWTREMCPEMRAEIQKTESERMAGPATQHSLQASDVIIMARKLNSSAEGKGGDLQDGSPTALIGARCRGAKRGRGPGWPAAAMGAPARNGTGWAGFGARWWMPGLMLASPQRPHGPAFPKVTGIPSYSASLKGPTYILEAKRTLKSTLFFFFF